MVVDIPLRCYNVYMANIQPGSDSFLPEVVDDQGNKIVGPELEAVTGLVTQMAQLAQLAKIRKAAEAQNFQGIEDPRNGIAANDTQQNIDLIKGEPYTPWISVFFYNDGPDPVLIAINDFHKPFRLVPKATRAVDHAYGKKKLEIIYYQCDLGKTAVLDIIGQY